MGGRGASKLTGSNSSALCVFQQWRHFQEANRTPDTDRFRCHDSVNVPAEVTVTWLFRVSCRIAGVFLDDTRLRHRSWHWNCDVVTVSAGQQRKEKAMTILHRTLGAIVEYAGRLSKVTKEELDFGDWVLVTTANSTYSIHVIDGGLYSVSGGWFDRQGLSPSMTTINGCGWGGSPIKLDIVAACGLHLVFGNGVMTSAVQRIYLIRFGGEEMIN